MVKTDRWVWGGMGGGVAGWCLLVREGVYSLQGKKK